MKLFLQLALLHMCLWKFKSSSEMRALTRITQLLLRFSLYGRSSSIRIHGWITEEFGNSCCTTKLSFSSASTTEKWCQEKQEEITITRSTKIISWRSGPQKDNRTLLALIKPHCRQFIMKHGDSCSRSETSHVTPLLCFLPSYEQKSKARCVACLCFRC